MPPQNGWALTSSRPCREIEADTLHQLHRRPAAAASTGKGPAGVGRRRQSRLPGQDRLEQIGQKARELIEQPVDRRDRPAGLVLVEQRLIGAGSEVFGLDRGNLALQAQYPFQHGQNGSEIVLRPGIPPHRLAFRASARLGLDERRSAPRPHAAGAAASRANWRAAIRRARRLQLSASASRSPISGAVRC